ncbi:N-acyl homoserine lactonase family protein [Sphingosinicella sp. LHD-64]|uniref:N-acyl homoserine lactonase family protein n=1 Tax=Sphingosinicella sp. LHD-64 TaxID=3072139 RepID=UPI00280D8E20|nr:N-acyl homoserine lactonase family protein [Sphingosinicella sp. LHD-64]MDQ8757720.1 N-acyl homoserine lactonase family protein [Sphingosinicella sp. LHD-64]
MLKRIFGAALGSLALALTPAAAQDTSAAGPEIWRLDCGEILVTNLNVFSDSYLYEGRQKRLVDSCYLIRHGDRYLLWDTGLAPRMLGQTVEQGVFRMTLRERIGPQLARINVRPEQINFVGISHFHFDHTGQLADFPGATLLIGAEDWEVLRSGQGPEGLATPFRHWIDGGGTAEPVARDHDVFGDGSVVMLDMPGHTPGHHALLVRLRGRAPVLLSGDQFHFTEQVRNNGVPSFNTDRADTLASSDRLLSIARSLNAELIIQHEANDVARLPAFPESAR